MVRTTTAACLLALMSLIAAAQTVPTPRAAFVDRLQSAVVKSIGAQDKTVEITLTDSVLTILRVNSNPNASSHETAHPEGTVVDTVEFRKNAKGIFEIHVS